METEDDWDLISIAQGRDARASREAFAELWRRHVGTLYVGVLGRVKNSHVAEDITCEAFARAWHRIDTVGYQGSSVCAWFVTIAMNLIRDRAKSCHYKLERSTDVGELLSSHDAQRWVRSAEDEALVAATATEVRRGVAKLATDQRQCIELRFLQDRSRSEVAAAMSRSETAVSQLQVRAIKNLSRILKAAA